MTVACHFSRLLAIMGPSGGGKTSLLNALAGQVPETKGALPYAAFQRHPNAQPWMTISWRVAPRIESGLHVDHDSSAVPEFLELKCPWAAGMHLQGNIQVNGQPRGTASYKQAYVQQEDMFYAQLTVRGVSELASSSLCLV